jgi:hypothetical protein
MVFADEAMALPDMLKSVATVKAAAGIDFVPLPLSDRLPYASAVTVWFAPA